MSSASAGRNGRPYPLVSPANPFWTSHHPRGSPNSNSISAALTTILYPLVALCPTPPRLLLSTCHIICLSIHIGDTAFCTTPHWIRRWIIFWAFKSAGAFWKCQRNGPYGHNGCFLYYICFSVLPIMIIFYVDWLNKRFNCDLSGLLVVCFGFFTKLSWFSYFQTFLKSYSIISVKTPAQDFSRLHCFVW